jgi:hypothetical protein
MMTSGSGAGWRAARRKVFFAFSSTYLVDAGDLELDRVFDRHDVLGDVLNVAQPSDSVVLPGQWGRSPG